MNVHYKKLFCTLCLTILATGFVPQARAETPAASPADYAAIRQVVGLYIQSGKEGKSEIMQPAFHKDAIIYGVEKGVISGGPIQELFNFIDKHPEAKELNAEITAVDIAGTIACVRVESDKWHGARYSDMFLLLKDKEGWKIITKVFHTH